MQANAKSKPEKATDEEFKALIEDRLRTAMGAPGTQIAKERARNLDAYLAEPLGEWAPPEIEDRSQLVATDAADTVEWLLPSLLRVFASNRDAIDVSARRPEYEQQASMVREVVRWMFWDRMDGLTFLHSWLKDGLYAKVGFCRIGYCKSQMPVNKPYRGLTESQMMAVVSPEGVEVVGMAERVEETEAGPMKVYDVDLLVTESDGYPVLDVVPPEEMRIDNEARYGNEPTFIAQEYQRRRSALVAEGYPVEDFTGGSSTLTQSEEAQARRRINSTHTFDADDDRHDPLLDVAECFVRRGTEHAPIWERGLLIDGTMIERDEVEDHPFGWWCPAPMPHVFFGHCPVDYAIEPQRLRTRLLRAVEDNVYLTVNGRTGVVGGDETTIDDLLDSRPGGVVRLKTRDDLVPIVQPDMANAAWQAVEWAGQWTEHRTGFSRLSKGLSSDALNDTATGVMEITERADMRCELMARHAAAALAKVLTKMLTVMSRHQDVSQWAKIAGQWVEIDPRDWDCHYQVRVRVGLGAGNKDRQSAQLTQLLGIQQGFAQGGILQPPAAIHGARKLAETMGRDDAQILFPDPPPPNPNPPPPLPLLVEQAKAQASAAELKATQDHEYRMKMMELDARHKDRLFELAAGVMAARVAPQGAGPINLANGTQLDQSAQTLAMQGGPNINDVATAIASVADAIGNGLIQPNQPPMQ